MFLNVCQDSSFLRAIIIIKSFLKILFIVTPILVIIFSTIDFGSAVTAGKADVLQAKGIMLVKRLFACIIIFFVPSMVNYLVESFSTYNKEGLYQCLENATMEKVRYYEQLENERIKFEQDQIEGQVDTDELNETTKQSDGGNNGINNGSSYSSNVDNTTNYTPDFFGAIDNKHYNYVTFESKLTGNVVWSSNTPNIATVNNGVVTAVSGASGTAKIIATNGSVKEEYTVEVIPQRAANFVKDSVDYSNEVKEAYINNAEKICHSGSVNYIECIADTFPVYTGDFTSAVNFARTATKHMMSKGVGISATNYLIFVSSKKQTLTLLEKIDGIWKVKKSYSSSTGRNFSVKGDYSFAFYVGVVEYDSNPAVKNCKNSAINQFRQGKKKGGLRIKEANIKEPAISGRWIHYSPILGYPSSAGCNHLSCDAYSEVRDIVKDNLGTRVIVF